MLLMLGSESHGSIAGPLTDEVPVTDPLTPPTRSTSGESPFSGTQNAGE